MNCDFSAQGGAWSRQYYLSSTSKGDKQDQNTCRCFLSSFPGLHHLKPWLGKYVSNKALQVAEPYIMLRKSLVWQEFILCLRYVVCSCLTIRLCSNKQRQSQIGKSVLYLKKQSSSNVNCYERCKRLHTISSSISEYCIFTSRVVHKHFMMAVIRFWNGLFTIISLTHTFCI